jgi:spore maturation protein CgeB
MTRVFGVDYQFLSCGDVFTEGLAHAAADLGLAYAHADWAAPDLAFQIETFAPDLIFVVHGRRFAQRFYNLKGFGVPTAVWLLDEPYEVDDTAAWSSRFDHVFVNDVATLDRHPRAARLPVCYDPHVHQPAGLERPFRVGFIGGGNPTRDAVLGALARAGLLDYVVGGAWDDPDVARRCVSPGIIACETARYYQSTRIVVNVFRDRHHFNRNAIPATAMNPRIYEALACGALVVSEWRPELARVPDLPTFDRPAECVALVRTLLAAEADEVERLRGRCAVALADDTYAARLQTVLTVMRAEVAA